MIEDLKELGLTDGEAKVYIALTELGSSTVGPIVKKAKVAYSNVYEILDRLLDKGIISYITKERTKYFQAVSPNNLLDFLDKKEDQIKQQKKKAEKLLPQLKRLQDIQSFQDAEIFTGTKGLRSAYNKLFEDMTLKDEELFFYIHEDEYAEESDKFYFSIQSKMNKFPMKGISNKEYKESKFFKQTNYIDLRTVDFPVPGIIDICKDKLLLVSWEKPVSAVLIHSKGMANHFRKYFYTIWNQAKS